MATRREFRFREGASDKFWAVTLDGKKQTVQFGRTGTRGQEQEKKFPTAEAARSATDKLVAEKLKKGYVEVCKAGPAPKTPGPAKDLPPAPAPEPPQALAAPDRLTVTRSLDLDPVDWLWATWRPRRPLPRPGRAPAPFDLDACLAELKAKVQFRTHGWCDWGQLRLAQPLSREEAHFWMEALTRSRQNLWPSSLAEKLARQKFDGRVTGAEAAGRLRGMQQAWPNLLEPLYGALGDLLPPGEFVELAADDYVAGHPNMGGWALFTFEQSFWPYLTAEEAEQLRPVLRPHLDPQGWQPAPSGRVPEVYHIAALVGMHAEMRALVESWPDDKYNALKGYDVWVMPQRIVLGLGDARLVQTHMRRLRLHLRAPEYVRAWLAHTEFDGLDLVRDSILECRNKSDAEGLTKALALARAPEAAPFMLEVKLGSKASAVARAWLDEHAGNAIAGLIPVAPGRGKLAEAALDYLRQANAAGHGPFIEEQLGQAAPEAARKVRQEVLGAGEGPAPLDDAGTPGDMRAALAAVPPGKGPLPDWVRPANLRPLAVGDRRLNDAQVEVVLAALRQSTLDAPAPLVAVLKQHVAPAALDAFAWRLFELWLGEGAPSKERWALLAVGLLGGDACALGLTPYLRAWPGESQHQRAVAGLECLRAIGTDTALMQLNGIAQKLKFQGLKNKAREFMEAVARDKGLSRAELEDRIVPDLDLDPRGTRVLDFGPRRFTVVLGPDLAPLVKDEAGKLKADLPKPAARDDAEKANAAVAEWKLLKKQLREALRVQAPRLEQAMVTGRRWPVPQFEALLVRHPLLTNLARRLLWGAYDAGGHLTAAFRVTEDQACADAEDRPWKPDGAAAVGIVHPLHLTEEQRRAWGEVFADYELIAPFPQLGRPVYAVSPEEARGKVIDRMGRTKVPALALRGTLEKRGWTRGSAADHGVIQEFSKPFPGAGVTALLEIEPGIPLGLPDWTEDQKVERVFFLKGIYEPLCYPRHPEKDFVPLKRVDPVALSEVLGDLAALVP
jgi:predicted DNA-binding WGR domain protein